jgi:hypothetical protein
MKKEELDERVRLHGLWFRGEDGGKRADLSGADTGEARFIQVFAEVK